MSWKELNWVGWMRPSHFLLAWVAILLPSFIPVRVVAGNIDSNDNAWLVRNERLFRFDYANDFFTGTDRYYTQGYGFALFHSALAKSPLINLLVALHGGSKSYGLTFRHCGFTPTTLDSDAALIGDRPFASYLFLGHSLISSDPRRDLTLISELDTGLIGEGSGGKQIQTGLHRALGSSLPRGWDNQIRNDLVLDYYVRIEKRVAATALADAAIFVDSTLGTLYTNAAAGLASRFGKITDDNNRLYLFGRLEQKVVGYDATLQGGLFNRNSPYTLPTEELERFVLRGEVGITIERKGYALQFTRSFQGREFKSGFSHQWAEISFIRHF